MTDDKDQDSWYSVVVVSVFAIGMGGLALLIVGGVGYLIFDMFRDGDIWGGLFFIFLIITALGLAGIFWGGNPDD